MFKEGQPLRRPDIEQILPHRRPFLFLEKAEVLGWRATGQLADLSHPDFEFLRGHFPNFPVIPGAIIMEALAELSGVVVASGAEKQGNKIGVLLADKMRYRQMVRPGDCVQLEVEITAMKRNIGKSSVKALKEGKIVAEGEIAFALIDKPTETVRQ